MIRIKITEHFSYHTMHTHQFFIRSFTLFIVLTSTTFAIDKFSETKNGNSFLNQLVVEHNHEQLNLSLTGLATRKKFFLNIYSMAHYIEQEPDVANQDILNSDNAANKVYENILHSHRTKQISMVFLRSLKANQIKKSLLSSIQSNTSEEDYKVIQPQIDEFIEAIYSDVKKNDEFVIRWFPDGTVVALFAGQQISIIHSERFARTLWLIWFGENSVIDRKSLIEKLLTSS